MKNVHIVTDSTCHIPAALCQELEIHVVQLPYVWDNITYFDDEISPREFYTKLRTSKVLPITSGPPPGSFKAVFESLGSDGSSVLAILMADIFSSTYRSANLAKEMTTGLDITLFDSGMTTMGLGFQVLAAARAARDGKSLEEITLLLNQVRNACGVVFSVSDLKFLRRGGRISHLQQFVATTFNLTPILEIKGGPIRPVERVWGKKNVIPRILHLVAERLNNDLPIRMAAMHADNETMAWELAKQARERFSPVEMIISEIAPVQGIHTGPGAVGLVYSSGV
jgi:DegV family protein with EDD domain